MKKRKSSDFSFEATGGKLDEDGRPTKSGKGTVKKGKKSKREKHEPVVIEDNKFKLGEKKDKKRKTEKLSDKDKALKKASKDVDKKSKKKPGKGLALTDPERVTKKRKKNEKSRKEVTAFIEEVERMPAPVDEYDAEARRMFETQCHLAQRLEEQMEERIYNKDVYALATIYSSIRELIADLRASRDVTAQVAELEQVVLSPYHKVVGEALSGLLFHVDAAVSKFVANEDIRNEIKKKLVDTMYESAQTIQSEYEQSIERVRRVLQ